MPLRKAIERQDIQPGQMRSVEIDGRDILLVRHDLHVSAYENLYLKESSSSLADGDLRDGFIFCPARKIIFNALTGRCENADLPPLKRLPVLEDAQHLYVEI